MKLRLRTQLVLSHCLLALFLVSSLLFLSNLMMERYFQSYVQQKQVRTNGEVVAAVSAAFSDGVPSRRTMRQLGQEALRNGLVLTIYDQNGRQLYCADCDDRHHCDRMRSQLQKNMRTRYSNWDGELRKTNYPLVSGGRRYGTVEIGHYGEFFYTSEDLQFIRLFNGVSVGISGLMLLFGLGFSTLLAKRITGPIDQVTGHTRAIAAGQYDQRLSISSNTKELEDLMESVNTLAESLQQQLLAKRRMAGNYAHELRTPLATLQSLLEGMMDGVLEPTPQRLESCRDEILRLARMVGQLDRIVELEDGDSKLHLTDLDFSALLQQILPAFDRTLQENGLTLQTHIRPCILRADGDQLRQVIVNLISNAIKYTDPGGRITVSALPEGEQLRFSVADTGVGVAPEDLPHLFEHLYRTDRSRTRNTGGSGIGLSVVRAIVEAHGGTVFAESTLGEGSTFTVLLPTGHMEHI